MSNSGQEGGSLGNAIKGAFNTVHGIGETIRGTINDGADQIGEGIASDGKSTGPSAERQEALKSAGHAPQDHGSTVEQGKQEINQGVGALQGAGGQGSVGSA